MQVEGATPVPRPVGDVGHGDRVVAVLDDQRDGRLDQRPAGAFLLFVMRYAGHKALRVQCLAERVFTAMLRLS